MSNQNYEPWVAPLLEKMETGIKDFPEPEKAYFYSLIQYEIDKNNEPEAAALIDLVDDINTHPTSDRVGLCRYIAKVFQHAGIIATSVIKKN